MRVYLPKKRSLYVVTAVLLLFSVFSSWSGIFYVTPSWKVVDPSDTRFDPFQLDFRDYMSPEYKTFNDRCRVVQTVIPNGMSEEIVDKILVGSAKSWVISETESKKEYLNHRASNAFALFIGSLLPIAYGGRSILVQYDKNRNVENVMCGYLSGPFDFAMVKYKVKGK